MEFISSGYSNDATFRNQLVEIIKRKEHEYIIAQSFPKHAPGTVGASFEWKISGTNELKDLVERKLVGTPYVSIYKRGLGMIAPEKIAKLYLDSLSPEERENMKEKMLIEHMLKR